MASVQCGAALVLVFYTVTLDVFVSASMLVIIRYGSKLISLQSPYYGLLVELRFSF